MTEDEKSSGGVIVPGTAALDQSRIHNFFWKGVVVRVADEESQYSPNQVVYFDMRNSAIIQLKGREYVVVPEVHVVAFSDELSEEDLREEENKTINTEPKPTSNLIGI